MKAYRDRSRGRIRVEWLTISVAAIIYSAFGLLTWFHSALPWWALVLPGAYVLAWHSSLQHEVVHGHPTSRPWLNELLVFPNLWLWMPYRLYRSTHLAHHRNERLTHPVDDPESYYMTAESWTHCGPLAKRFHELYNTLAGRLLFGPAVVTWQLYAAEAKRLARGDTRHVGAWIHHAIACAVVLIWVSEVCGLAIHWYVALFVYPGISLSLVRSFLEHRAHRDTAKRTVVVEAGRLMSLVFLNNNLHAVHHQEPGRPWYTLPERYREQRDKVLVENGSYVYAGYGEVFKTYLLRRKEPVLHPSEAIGRDTLTGHPPSVVLRFAEDTPA